MNSTSWRMKNSKQTPLVAGGRFKWTPLEAGWRRLTGLPWWYRMKNSKMTPLVEEDSNGLHWVEQWRILNGLHWRQDGKGRMMFPLADVWFGKLGECGLPLPHIVHIQLTHSWWLQLAEIREYTLISSGGQIDEFRPFTSTLGGGVWGAGTNMWHPEAQASYESLPAPLATQIPTLLIHKSGGGAGSDIRSISSIRPICKCRCPPLLIRILKLEEHQYNEKAWYHEYIVQAWHTNLRSGRGVVDLDLQIIVPYMFLCN